MSAHVVPKAAAYAQPHASALADADEEKTTIESGWEDEASTTVEQGDVADKLRALAPLVEPKKKRPAQLEDSGPGDGRAKIITNITSTNGMSMAEELTVDDQRGHAALALLAPPTTGKLVITQGNDAGVELEVRPGKSYTIGRGLDNDVVLTDIAVSRKHFDLRHEGGAWVIVDRGSGNGTLVNGVFEDQPFMLANGDVIEIGNTSFRFDLAGAPVVASRPSATEGLDVDLDEPDEPSTVAGKVPVRAEDIPTPQAAPFVPMRPKTAPPPPLPRPRTVSGQNAPPSPMGGVSISMSVPMAVPVGPSQVMSAMSAPMSAAKSAALPATTMPLPQMANRGPLERGALSGIQPSTLPGQPMGSYAPPQNITVGAPPIPLPPAPSAPMSAPYGYMHISNGMPQQPDMFGMQPPPQQQPYMDNGMHGMQQPQMLGHPNGHNGMEFSPLMIAAGPGGRDATTTGLVPPTPYGHVAYGTPAYGAPTLSRRTKLMLGGGALSLLAAIATIAIIKGTSSDPVAKTDKAAKADKAALQAEKGKPTVEPITQAKAEPKAAKAEPKPPAKPDVKPDPKPDVKPEPKAAQLAVTAPPPVAPQPPPKDPKAEERQRQLDKERAAAAETKRATAAEKKREREEAERLAKAEKAEKRAREREEKKARERQAKLDRASKPAATAVATSTGGVRDKADSLYRAKKFNDAANTLRKAAPGSDDETKLRTLAGAYENMGKAYNVGMASGTKPADAYRNLTRAKSFDRTVGGAYTDEIESKLREIAPRAAVSLVGTKDYPDAYAALRVAESLGGATDSTRLVRTKLETAAGQLYGEAEQEIKTKPDVAREKLKRIRAMVDAKHPWHAKATKLLATST